VTLRDLIESRSASGELPSAAEAPGSAPVEPAEESPQGVAETLTPSGISVYFQAAPKRLYRVRDPFSREPSGHEDWIEVPSVTNTLDLLGAFGAGANWGQRIGVEGLQQLFREGLPIGTETPYDDINDLLKKRKLTVNYVRDKAADRGTSVHAGLEAWAESGGLPVVDVYPASEQGFVRGLVQFLEDSHVVPLLAEVMVASVTDLYAGRFDLLARIPANTSFVVKTYPKRKPVFWSATRDEVWLIDMKTRGAKGTTYEKDHLQLAAYENGFIECGYGEQYDIDRKGVLMVTEDGRYSLTEGKATYPDYLAVRRAWDALERVKAA